MQKKKRMYTDLSDNRNSSCDSDQLQRSDPSYHDKGQAHQRGDIPVHRNESISISDMEKYATDVEVSLTISLYGVCVCLRKRRCWSGSDTVCCLPDWRLMLP